MRRKSGISALIITCAAILCACGGSAQYVDTSVADSLSEMLTEETAQQTDQTVQETENLSKTSFVSEETETENETEASSENTETTAAETDKADVYAKNAEKQIKILEDYYSSLDCDPMNPKIYDVGGDGECILVYTYYEPSDEILYDGWGHEYNGIYKNMAISVKDGKPYELISTSDNYFIDSGTQIVISYCEQTHRFYYYTFYNGHAFEQGTDLCSIKNGEPCLELQYTFNSDGYLYNGYRIFDFDNGLSLDEIPCTRKDGDIEIYLPDYSQVKFETISVKGKMKDIYSAPEIITEGDSAVLSWQEIYTADGYRIYKKDGDSYTFLAETSDTSARVELYEGGAEYCVTVFADDPSIAESDYSPTVYGEKALDLSKYTLFDFFGCTFNDIYNYVGKDYVERFDYSVGNKVSTGGIILSTDTFPNCWFKANYDDPKQKIKEIMLREGYSLDGFTVGESGIQDFSDKYGIKKCELNSFWYEGQGGYCVTASFVKDGYTYAFIYGGLLDYHDFPQDSEDSYDDFCVYVKKYYDGKEIDISDLKYYVEDDSTSKLRIVKNN